MVLSEDSAQVVQAGDEIFSSYALGANRGIV